MVEIESFLNKIIYRAKGLKCVLCYHEFIWYFQNKIDQITELLHNLLKQWLSFLCLIKWSVEVPIPFPYQCYNRIIRIQKFYTSDVGTDRYERAKIILKKDLNSPWSLSGNDFPIFFYFVTILVLKVHTQLKCFQQFFYSNFICKNPLDKTEVWKSFSSRFYGELKSVYRIFIASFV